MQFRMTRSCWPPLFYTLLPWRLMATAFTTRVACSLASLMTSSVREVVITRLHSGDYSAFLPDDSESYCSSMSQLGAWGSELEARAIADMLNLNAVARNNYFVAMAQRVPCLLVTGTP
eukprot:Skav232515  [mRNA]  locus=scaffold1096:713100:713453:+ [translate_table: standard]